MTSTAVRLALLLPLLCSTAHAQLITIKTIPIAQADQFQVFPSRNVGMGGVSIALPDTVADLASNPAKGARLQTIEFFSAPSAYSVTRSGGSGRSLPMGAVTRAWSWFGGVSAALQEIDLQQRLQQQPIALPFDVQGNAVPTQNGPHGNKYLYGLLGKSLANGLSVGASAFWADLHAVDGVDRLYANSQSVRQSGFAADIRAGIMKQFDGGAALDAVILHNRYSLTHDVTWVDPFFDPATARNSTRARVTNNLDHTNVWGLQLAYTRPLSAPGLTLGGQLTANRMSHPKLPEYEFAQTIVLPWLTTVPWDPGHTNAFNFGVGLAKVDGASSFAVDLLLEPIWTHTWGEAQSPLTDRNGATIPTGGRTIENWFHFRNAIIRLGVDRKVLPTANVQLGLNIHTVSYRFWQLDHVQISGQSSTQGWSEITPTWGLRLRFPELELRYQGRVTSGMSRPGALDDITGFARNNNKTNQASILGGDILSPPSDVSMGRVKLFTHMVSISIPLARFANARAAR